jgi:hypothetical protein
MNIYFLFFFLYHLKSGNKLDVCIYTYFFINPIIPLNNFFYNKIVVGFLKKRIKIFFCYIVLLSVLLK